MGNIEDFGIDWTWRQWLAYYAAAVLLAVLVTWASYWGWTLTTG